MQYIAGTTDIHLENTGVVIGKFDGMHIGHQFLYQELKKHCKIGCTTVMFTFDMHPGTALAEKKIQNIYTIEEKRYLLEQDGPDILISYPFTKETADMSASAFILEVLKQKLGTKMLVAGKDFCFGKNREGNVDTLSSYAEVCGYELRQYDKVMFNGRVVSSTLIREELSNGSLTAANQLLGRPFLLIGKVMHGRKLGRRFGMPTINLLPLKEKLLPPNGVYFSITELASGRYHGITNIGVKPTISQENQLCIETHLFQFEEDVYGETAVVELYQFSRAELQFESMAILGQQVKKDIENAKVYFRNNA